MKPLDSFKHKGLRRKLVSQLRSKGIDNEKVLAAIDRLPRHFFMDSAFLQFAYDDTAFPIGEGQTISQPYTVAVQSDLLDVHPGMKVLEIGTGSGYQAAILFELGAKVYTIERHRPLFKKAKQILSLLNTTVKVFYGDGYKGLPAFAPFDRVLVTCGAPSLPEELINQLKPGGVMVVPIGEGEVQVMSRIVKNPDGTLEQSTHGTFRFVPMLENRIG